MSIPTRTTAARPRATAIRSFAFGASLAFAGVMASSVAASSSQTVSLDVTQVPSAQPPWAYFQPGGTPLPEANVFTPGPGYITLDTITGGYNACLSGGNSARVPFDPVPTDGDYTVELVCVARIVETQFICNFYYGFTVIARIPGLNMSIGITDNTIQFPNLDTIPFEYGTGFRTYRLVGDTRNDTFDLYIDGQFITSQANIGGGEADALIGDGTGGANSIVDIQSFTVTVTPVCTTDLDGTGTTDLADLLTVLGNFGSPGTQTDGDTNNDGTVDLTDLLAVLADFGNTCP